MEPRISKQQVAEGLDLAMIRVENCTDRLSVIGFALLRHNYELARETLPLALRDLEILSGLLAKIPPVRKGIFRRNHRLA